MEIFQTIWNVLTTPNEGLINILNIPLSFIEIYVIMLLFTTVLNIYTSRKTKLFYVLAFSAWTIFSNSFIPKGYIVFINIILIPFFIKWIFNISWFKALLSQVIHIVLIAALETLIIKIYSLSFNIDLINLSSTAIYICSARLFIYCTLYLTYKICVSHKLNITILEYIDKKNKFTLLLNLILACLTIAIQFYIIGYYNDILPMFVVILSLITLLAYFAISVYSIIKTTNLQIITQNLEEAQLYNKSLKILHDNVRAFKHDFSNIVQSIGRLYWFKRYARVRNILFSITN